MENNCEVSTVLYRVLTGGNVKKAAYVCGVSDKTIYAWCEGANRVPDIQLIRLMRAFPGIAGELLGPDLIVTKSATSPFCGLKTNEIITDAQAELGKALADGKITHDEKPGLFNKFHRAYQHLQRQLPGLAA